MSSDVEVNTEEEADDLNMFRFLLWRICFRSLGKYENEVVYYLFAVVHMFVMCMYIASISSTTSKASASDILEDIKERFPHYYMHSNTIVLLL